MRFILRQILGFLIMSSIGFNSAAAANKIGHKMPEKMTEAQRVTWAKKQLLASKKSISKSSRSMASLASKKHKSALKNNKKMKSNNYAQNLKAKKDRFSINTNGTEYKVAKRFSKHDQTVNAVELVQDTDYSGEIQNALSHESSFEE